MSRRKIAVIVVGLSVLLGAVPLVRAAVTPPPWKGAESLSLVGLAPNPERCGAPPVLEARLTGDGIDTVGGVFAVVASGCINPDTLEVTDLEATDRFSPTDSISVKPEDLALTLNPVSCIATNAVPARFDVVGGTGRFADVDGHGTYHLALNWPACNGVTAPARVWFQGVLGTAQE